MGCQSLNTFTAGIHVMLNRKTRYAVVGTGGRSIMCIDALAGKYKEHGSLVGFCDVSPTRMKYYNDRIASEFSHPPVPTFLAADFDRMIAEQKPDTVIVTSMDSTHHEYICRAMDKGCDVITEKPMTTDAEKARQIMAAIQRTGRKLRVTFNYRYVPHATKVRELIRDGAIGVPTAVDFSWSLDTRHGADYFRRWHREKDKSGGLLVHKSTHHFDIINWWIGSYPERVFALGELKFYGRKNAEERGDGERTKYDRYTGVPEASGDPFAITLDSSARLKGLYLDAEADSGYIRDRNVFGDNITAEDTMAVTARYRNGVILNYSLICYSPWEGYRAILTGTRGRLVVEVNQGSHVIGEEKEMPREQHSITLWPMFKGPRKIEAPTLSGGHGGGDALLAEDLFSPNPPPDPFNRAAGYKDGAASILLGISANESIHTGLPVNCDDLLKI